MQNLARKVLSSDYASIFLLFILILFASILIPNFFTSQNILNVVNRSTNIAIAAVGMTYVIVGGGIDLSIAGTLIFSAYLGLVTLLDGGINVEVSVLLMIIFGAFIGLLNGINVVYLKIPPFIATLAMLSMTRGLSLHFFKAATIFNLPERYLFLSRSKLLKIPMPIIIFLFLSAIAHYILNYTIFGRSIYAVGSNSKAAWYSGVNINKTVIGTFVFCGTSAAISGIFLSSRMNALAQNMAVGLELQVIAAVVIGGGSLMGGEGNVIGSIVGALIIAFFSNILTLIGVSPYVNEFYQGALLWGAVVIDMIRRRKLILNLNQLRRGLIP